MSKLKRKAIFPLVVVLAGCSGGPDRFEAPRVDTESAATKAIELYDVNGDGALNQEELIKCPGMLSNIAAYDRNVNGSIERDEIAKHLSRLLNRTGGTQLDALVLLKGRPLGGATVNLEPEPYLGTGIQAAQGVTDKSGLAELAIPPEYVPEHLRRLKTVHYGTFKVRLTHPSVVIPAKYNTETEIGYETEPGNPSVTFNMSDK